MGKENNYPPYAKLWHSHLIHRGGGEYYRHAGGWAVKALWKDNELICRGNKGPMSDANGHVLIECSQAEWQKDNEGYV